MAKNSGGGGRSGRSGGKVGGGGSSAESPPTRKELDDMRRDSKDTEKEIHSTERQINRLYMAPDSKKKEAALETKLRNLIAKKAELDTTITKRIKQYPGGSLEYLFGHR